MMTLGRAIFAAVLFCALTSAAFAAAAKQPTTAGSFLKYRADSPAELAAMVRQDPDLAARYSRHFGTTDSAVADFFENQVSLIRLRQSKTAMVYFVSSGGRVVSNKRVFPAGTLVFATRQGEPVLDWRCGNPLMSSLPISQARAAAKDAAAAASPITPAAQPEGQVAALAAPQEVIEQVLDQPPMELVATMLQPAVLTPPTAPVMIAALPSVVEAAIIPAVTAVDTVPAVVQGSRGLGWLLPLAAIGGVAGGSGNRSPELPPPGPGPVIPEPSALMILASGVAATGIGALRRRMISR